MPEDRYPKQLLGVEHKAFDNLHQRNGLQCMLTYTTDKWKSYVAGVWVNDRKYHTTLIQVPHTLLYNFAHLHMSNGCMEVIR